MALEKTMQNETRHFVLTQDGFIREFTTEQAAQIASGTDRLPEYAQRRLRYLQVTFNAEAESEIRVQTAGAAIQFDADGRLAEATAPKEDEKITRFEHDACVQWALRELAVAPLTMH